MDDEGAIYMAGHALSEDFPVKNSLQSFKGGGVLGDDFFIANFVPARNALVYSTFLGGRGNGNTNAICIDRSSNVYFVGETTSLDSPTVNALQPLQGRGFDGVLAKISDSTP